MSAQDEPPVGRDVLESERCPAPEPTPPWTEDRVVETFEGPDSTLIRSTENSDRWVAIQAAIFLPDVR